MKRRALLLGLAALPAAMAGCASAAPSPLPPPAPPAPLHLDPLAGLFPAGGLDWIASVRPGELLRAQPLGQALSTLLPPENLDRLAAHLGFDPRLADQIVTAGYGASTLYALRVAHDPHEVEARFTERMTGTIERATDGPGVVRLTSTLGTKRRAMAVLEQSVLLFEIGPGDRLRAAVAFAQGKLKKARPALQAEPLAQLARRLGDAPALLLAPASSDSPLKGAHGLIEKAAAAGVAATPSPEGLRLRGLVLGAWDDPPTEALHRLGLTLGDLARSPVGHLIGLGEPLSPWTYGGDRDAIHVEGALDPLRLAQGLRAATSAELNELFPAQPPASK
jgi:hypothetical protein